MPVLQLSKFHYEGENIGYHSAAASGVEPEPDYLDGAGAGIKAPAPECCCLV